MFQGDDQTITCTAQGDRVTVQNGYNHKAQYNERMMGVSYVSSLLTCLQISHKAQYNERMMGVCYVSSLLTYPQISHKAQYSDGAFLRSAGSEFQTCLLYTSDAADES